MCVRAQYHSSASKPDLGGNVSRVNTNKDLAVLEKLAKYQGWEVSRRNGGHIEWKSPAGVCVIGPSTPSSYSSLGNVKSDLKKAGLVLNKADAIRARRGEQERERFKG